MLQKIHLIRPWASHPLCISFSRPKSRRNSAHSQACEHKGCLENTQRIYPSDCPIDASVPSASRDTSNGSGVHPYGLDGWREVEDEHTATKSPGRALPSPPLPSLTPSHQAKHHSAAQTHTLCRGKYTHSYIIHVHLL